MSRQAQLNVLVGCEKSGKIRRAVQALGHTCFSCDIEAAVDGETEWHLRNDVVQMLHEPPNGRPWDFAIVHVPCTRLTRAGRHWLFTPPNGRTEHDMWQDYFTNIELFRQVWNAPVARLAIENPRMHDIAVRDLADLKIRTQYVQPYWFGHEAFKETGFYKRNLPDLQATNMLRPPIYGSPEYKKWSAIVNTAGKKNRASIRSETYTGIAEAIANQWCSHVSAHGRQPKSKIIKRR